MCETGNKFCEQNLSNLYCKLSNVNPYAKVLKMYCMQTTVKLRKFAKLYKPLQIVTNSKYFKVRELMHNFSQNYA